MVDMEATSKENSQRGSVFEHSKLHITCAEHQRYLSPGQEQLDKALADAKRGRIKATSQSEVLGFHNREVPEIVYSSIETSSDCCNDSTLETGDQCSLSSQNQFRARPNHNQWRSMDDEDTLYETPAPKKNTIVYVDLTLSWLKTTTKIDTLPIVHRPSFVQRVCIWWFPNREYSNLYWSL